MWRRGAGFELPDQARMGRLEGGDVEREAWLKGLPGGGWMVEIELRGECEQGCKGGEIEFHERSKGIAHGGEDLLFPR